MTEEQFRFNAAMVEMNTALQAQLQRSIALGGELIMAKAKIEELTTQLAETDAARKRMEDQVEDLTIPPVAPSHEVPSEPNQP